MDTDSGLVIYNKVSKLYYAGLNTWQKGLRHAKVYHSERYLREAIDSVDGKKGIEKKDLCIRSVEVNAKDTDLVV